MSHEAPTVEEYLINKSKNRIYEKVPIGRFKNIQLAVEQGTDPEIPPSELPDLVKFARQSVNLFRRLRAMTGRRSTLYKDLKQTAATYPGFGGFDLTNPKASIRIKPEDEITWDGPVLKERLGKTASAVVSEKLQMSLVIPLGHVMPDGEVITAEKATAAFYLGVLAPLGFSEDDEATTFSSSVEYTVNEELLTEMVEQGQVKSLEGTAVVTRKFTTPDITI